MRVFLTIFSVLVFPLLAMASTIESETNYGIASKFALFPLKKTETPTRSIISGVKREYVWRIGDDHIGHIFPQEPVPVLLSDDLKLLPESVLIAFESKHLDYVLPDIRQPEALNSSSGGIYRVPVPAAMTLMLSVLSLLVVRQGAKYARKPFAYGRSGLRSRYFRWL